MAKRPEPGQADTGRISMMSPEGEVTRTSAQNSPYCPQQAGPVSRLKRLIFEIQRRSLWQLLGIYLGGAWAALQGIEALVSVLTLHG